MKKYIIVFYTAEARPPEIFFGTNSEQMESMLTMIVELTKKKAKFAVYELGPCVGDFS